MTAFILVSYKYFLSFLKYKLVANSSLCIENASVVTTAGDKMFYYFFLSIKLPPHPGSSGSRVGVGEVVGYLFYPLAYTGC